MKITISLLAVLSLAVSAQAQDPAKSYTVKSAVSLALGTHPSVRGAHEAAKESAARKRSAISGVFPTVSGSFRGMQRKDAFNEFSQLFGGETYNFYEVGLEAEQPIFQGGAFLGGLKYYGAEADLREKELEIAKRDLVAQTVRTFYELLISQKKVETIERHLKLQKDMLARTESRLRTGTSRHLDVYQMRGAVANLKPQLLEAQSERTLHATRLGSLLGLKDQTKIRVTGNLEASALPPPPSEKTETGSRLELERADLAVRQAEGAKLMQMSKHWPKLSLFGNWSRNATVRTQLTDADRTSYAVGVRLTVPIFSGLSSLSDRAALAAAEARAEYERESVLTDMSVDFIKADQDVKAGLELVKARDEALTAHRAALKEAQNRYSSGVATYFQLSDTQKNALDSELAADQSKMEYINRLARYYVSRGRSLDPLLESLDTKGNQ